MLFCVQAATPAFMSEYDVLIVDDDPFCANLLEDLVGSLGFSARCLLDPSVVVEELRRARPRLLVLDIVMPGADGLSLCMDLKPLTDALGCRIAVTSGKAREIEEPRAKRAGAAAFLRKPYDNAEIHETLLALLGARPPTRRPAGSDVVVTIWGSRGGTPASGASAYGVNTPCVSVGLLSGEVLILDAGTGIRDCADSLLKYPGIRRARILLTHYHPRHIEGLRGLPLLSDPGFTLRFGGPRDVDTDLGAMVRDLGAKGPVDCTVLEEQAYDLDPGATLEVMFTNHPTTTLAFAIKAAGQKIVYCPDTELPIGDQYDVGQSVDRLRQFALGADLLILNSHFSPEDHASSPQKGYSSWPAAVRLAVDAGAQRLCLFHAAAAYSDAELAAQEAAAKEAAGNEAIALDCAMAREGTAFKL
ncbi:MAG: response regulator [Elusimicrobia bacterium]|nr:response regulator [Elusimicrobiota bacterium]